MEENNVYPRIILGLDISTACIGVSVIEDNGDDTPKILELTHVSPKISNKIKGIEALFLRKNVFENDFIPKLAAYGITDVVIEEPLLGSNNVNTVATLLRFNGMIAECIYRILGLIPNFISSYDARMYSFPELVALRKYNKKGEVYKQKHVADAIKKDNIVLFGNYPFDIDKKTVMMNMVNEKYPGIPWVISEKGLFKKENYDACDSLICALAYVNINHHGLERPVIKKSEIKDIGNGQLQVNYTTGIWGKEFNKSFTINKD
jgi:hypothetical protein